MIARAKPRRAAGMSRFFFLMACSGVGLGMVTPLTAIYVKSFGGSDAAAGLAVGVITISLLSVDVFGTTFIPRVNPRLAIGLAMVIFGIGSMVSAVATGLPMIMVARMIQGIGGALALGGGLQLTVRTAGEGSVGKAVASFNAAWFAGVAIGPPLAGALSQVAHGQTGLRLAFVSCTVINWGAAIAALFWLPPLPREDDDKKPALSVPRLRDIGGLVAVPSLTLGAVGQGLRGSVVMTLLPLFGLTLGLAPSALGAALFALSCADVGSTKLCGALVDRCGPAWILAGALGAGALAALAGSSIHGIVPFSVLAVVMGVAVGTARVVPVTMVVAVADDTEAGLAGYRIAADIGMGLSSLAMGAVVGISGTRGAMRWLAVALAAASAFAFWAGRRVSGETEVRGAEARIPAAATPAKVAAESA